MDGLLGIGGRPGLSGAAAEWVEEIPEDAWVVAVDLPSGADPAGEVVLGDAVFADETVTFGVAKPVHLLPATEPAVGRLTVVDIGLASARPRNRRRRIPAGRGAADLRRRPAALAGARGELGQVLARRGGHRRGNADLPGGGRAERPRRARGRAGNGPVRRAAGGPGPGPRGRAGGGHRRGTGAGVGMRVGVRPGRPRQGRRGAEAPRRGGAGQRPAGGRRRGRAGAAATVARRPPCSRRTRASWRGC